LAVASGDSIIRILELATGTVAAEVRFAHRGLPTSLQ
jgi:hypothetical protein